MTITSLPPVMGLAEWDEFTAGQDERFELVRGVPVMSPSESNLNSRIAFRVRRRLDEVLPSRWAVLPQVEVLLTEGRGCDIVRIPDLVVASAEVAPRAHRNAASDIALAVEVVSPSSVVTDWMDKRDEYAAAGIARYLVIDPREPQPRMALFDRLVDGRYADPHPDGSRARLDIDGTVVDLRLAELLAW